MSLSKLVNFVHNRHPELPERSPSGQETILPSWRLPEVPGIEFPDWLRDCQPREGTEYGPERALGQEPPRIPPSEFRPELLVPEMLAFYLPFHNFGPKTWGIYLLESGVVRLASALAADTAWPEALEVALHALLVHEQFHATTEAGFTRMESLVGRELYPLSLLDMAAYPREEAMANASAARFARKKFPRVSPSLEQLMAKHPPGYRDFAQWLGPKDHARGLELLAEDARRYAGTRSLGGPGGFLFEPLSRADTRAIPVRWVFDGHRQDMFLPDWFLRRHAWVESFEY